MAKATKKSDRKVKARDEAGKPICGAKTRNGGVCRNGPMRNGRCRMHGGPNPGPAKGNQHARKHGLYSEYYTPEEEQQLDQVELGRVDDELKLCRIKLRRWLRYEAQIEKELETDDEAGMRYEEVKDESIAIKESGEDGGKTEVPGEKVTRTRRRINIEDNIDRLLRRIESLERTRKLLIGEDGDSDFEDELEKQINGDSET